MWSFDNSHPQCKHWAVSTLHTKLIIRTNGFFYFAFQFVMRDRRYLTFCFFLEEKNAPLCYVTGHGKHAMSNVAQIARIDKENGKLSITHIYIVRVHVKWTAQSKAIVVKERRKYSERCLDSLLLCPSCFVRFSVFVLIEFEFSRFFLTCGQLIFVFTNRNPASITVAKSCN